MSGKDTLIANEKSAETGGSVPLFTGTGNIGKKAGNKLMKFGALGAVLLVFVIMAGLISVGNLIPAAISAKLSGATNIQYADSVQSKQDVIQESLREGNIPNNTASLLKQNGAEVGYIENGEFVEGNNSGRESVIRYNGKIVSADDFKSVVNNDPGLYDAVNKATYSEAAYYYDDSANRVYSRLGISRNSYTNPDKSFEEVMNDAMGEGSSISINSVSNVEKEKESEYESDGNNATSNSTSAVAFVDEVRNKNKASSVTDATMNAASSLNTADTITKQQRSSAFFMAFMENISKMMAGEGSESRINEAMNYLYKEGTTNVVNVETGEIETVKGSMTESPSLYAILSDSRLDPNKVKGYSSDRIINTVNNLNGGSNIKNSTINDTVASTDNKVRGSIGRLISGNEVASSQGLDNIVTTVQDSLIDNSFGTINGIAAGEMLVDGAMNIGKSLAKASGATPGDEAAVKEYARLTSAVLAMDAKVDRMNRSPFDITSRNTFLGSILWNMAINFNGNTMMKTLGSVLRITGIAINKLSLSTYADDASNLYFSVSGVDCYTANSIGAMGWANGNTAVTFDTSIGNPFSDAGFESFVENNTTIDGSGNRTIVSGSTLASFIINNNEKLTPDGVEDAGILDSSDGTISKIPFISDIASMIKSFIGASSETKRKANGSAYLNSPENRDWDTYKYAQKYVSLARAQDALRQYDGDTTAYSNIKFFEGTENPVIAFLESLDSTTIAQH